MSDPQEQKPTRVEVYQLYIWVKEISPTIWRRLLVRSDCTIYDLHYALQLAFGWSDSHLHQFIIYGKPYGIYKDGGISFGNNPKEVRLSDLNWRINERFLYQYDLGANWEHEIRYEKRLDLLSGEKKTYPICMAGAGNVPPEYCRGPWHYHELCQHFSLYYIDSRLTDLIYEVHDNLEKDDMEQVRAIFEDNSEEVRQLQWWLDHRLVKFDRKGVNLYLKQFSEGNKEWLIALN